MNNKILLLISILFINSTQITYASEGPSCSEEGCGASCAPTGPFLTPGPIEDRRDSDSDILMRRDLASIDQSTIPSEDLQRKVQLYGRDIT